jgi:hypothetical protein
LQFLGEQYLHLSVDTAIQFVKQFLRIMGQPIDQTALQSVVLLTVEEANLMNPPHPMQTTSAGEGGAMIVESTN